MKSFSELRETVNPYFCQYIDRIEERVNKMDNILLSVSNVIGSKQKIFKGASPFKYYRVADSENMEIEHMTLQSGPFIFIQPAHSSDSNSNQAIIKEWGYETPATDESCDSCLIEGIQLYIFRFLTFFRSFG